MDSAIEALSSINDNNCKTNQTNDNRNKENENEKCEETFNHDLTIDDDNNSFDYHICNDMQTECFKHVDTNVIDESIVSCNASSMLSEQRIQQILKELTHRTEITQNLCTTTFNNFSQIKADSKSTALPQTIENDDFQEQYQPSPNDFESDLLNTNHFNLNKIRSYQTTRPNHQRHHHRNFNNDVNYNEHHHTNRRLNLDMSIDDTTAEELSLFADDNATAITSDNNNHNVDDDDDDFLNGSDNHSNGDSHNHYQNSQAFGLLLPEGSPRRFQIVKKSKFHCQSSSTLSNNNKHDYPMMTTTSPKKFRVLQSLSSAEYSTESSLDDEYMELFELESLDQESNTSSIIGFTNVSDGFPSDLNTLINGQIIKKSPMMKTPERREFCHQPSSARRCLTMSTNYNNIQQGKQQQQQQQQLLQHHNKEPKILQPIMECSTNRVKNNRTLNLDGLTPISTRNCYFKRPEPCEFIRCSPLQTKRYRNDDDGHDSDDDRENLGGSFTEITTNSNEIAITITPDVIEQNGQQLQQSQPLHPTCNLTNRKASPVLSSLRPSLRKSMSMNDAEIMSALARSESSDEPDLIGDFSKPYILPLVVNGRHRDLKSISSDTVARLLRGEFDNSVATYKIIDCRYPYEYEGGHIRGAKNLYTQEQVIEEFLLNTQKNNNKTETNQIHDDADDELINSNNFNKNISKKSNSNNGKRNIVIFHCEFSSERGPKLSRFLRNHDRARNTNSYPTLDYPEIYLLHNGYKEFYENYSELCEPHSYRPMLEPSYNQEYKRFRAKSKSWNGGGISTITTTNTINDTSNSIYNVTTQQRSLKHSKKSRSRLLL